MTFPDSHYCFPICSRQKPNATTSSTRYRPRERFLSSSCTSIHTPEAAALSHTDGPRLTLSWSLRHGDAPPPRERVVLMLGGAEGEPLPPPTPLGHRGNEGDFKIRFLLCSLWEHPFRTGSLKSWEPHGYNATTVEMLWNLPEQTVNETVWAHRDHLVTTATRFSIISTGINCLNSGSHPGGGWSNTNKEKIYNQSVDFLLHFNSRKYKNVLHSPLGAPSLCTVIDLLVVCLQRSAVKLTISLLQRPVPSWGTFKLTTLVFLLFRNKWRQWRTSSRIKKINNNDFVK